MTVLPFNEDRKKKEKASNSKIDSFSLLLPIVIGEPIEEKIQGELIDKHVGVSFHYQYA